MIPIELLFSLLKTKLMSITDESISVDTPGMEIYIEGNIVITDTAPPPKVIKFSMRTEHAGSPKAIVIFHAIKF